jgi:hypothetical protein
VESADEANNDIAGKAKSRIYKRNAKCLGREITKVPSTVGRPRFSAVKTKRDPIV